MNILLLGSGGREHALAWKLAQSRLLDDGSQLYVAPGNPGIAEHAELVTLDLADHGEVVAFCGANRIGLVVIGPERIDTDKRQSVARGAVERCDDLVVGHVEVLGAGDPSLDLDSDRVGAISV